MTSDDGLTIRQERRARVRMIRRRVLGASVALFMAVWMVIAVVLVTGHDPALARKTSTAAAAASTTTTAGTSSSGVSSSTGSTGSVSPVTSSQS
jgi:hypothetical protein